MKELEDHLLSANDHIEFLTQQLAHHSLDTVQEVSEEEEDYSFLQEERQHYLEWMQQIENILQISYEIPENSVAKRMEAITAKIPAKTTIVGNSYISLIQSEINELYFLIEGCKSDPSPIKQLHILQDSIRYLLSTHSISSLKDISLEKVVGETIWSSLYSSITNEKAEESMSRDDFLLSLKQLLADLRLKEEGIIRIMESLKLECADSLRLNQELYRESSDAKLAIQNQSTQITKLTEKIKKYS